jgi:hypothetical protein
MAAQESGHTPSHMARVCRAVSMRVCFCFAANLPEVLQDVPYPAL